MFIQSLLFHYLLKLKYCDLSISWHLFHLQFNMQQRIWMISGNTTLKSDIKDNTESKSKTGLIMPLSNGHLPNQGSGGVNQRRKKFAHE